MVVVHVGQDLEVKIVSDFNLLYCIFAYFKILDVSKIFCVVQTRMCVEISNRIIPFTVSD